VFTVGVQDLVTSGALDVMRERSDVGARLFHSIFEGLVDDERQRAALPRKPMPATEWRRIDPSTVEPTLREGVTFHDGGTPDAEDVVFTVSPERFGTLPERRAAQEAARGAVHRQRLRRARQGPAARGRGDLRALPAAAGPGRDGGRDDRPLRDGPARSDAGRPHLPPRLRGPLRGGLPRRREPAGAGAEAGRRRALSRGRVRGRRHPAPRGLRRPRAPPPIKELRFVVAPGVASRVKGPLSDECDVIADVPPDRIEIVEAAEGFQVVGGPIADLRLMVFDKTDGAMRDPLARRSPGTEREDRESDAAPDGASRPDRGFRRRRARRARAARGRPDAGAGPDAGPRRRIRWRQVDRPARGAGAARGARSRSGLRDVRGARAGGDAG